MHPKTLLAAILAGGLLAGAGFGGAAAQSDDPAGDVLSPASPEETAGDAGSDIGNPFESVEVQTLSQINNGELGLIGPENGGLDPEAWAGTDRLLVEILMPRLPGQPGSVTTAGLQRRLLLSRLKAPTGATGAGTSLFGARLARLVALGQIGAVDPLAQQAPGELATPSVVGARVDALFYQGREEEACGLVASVQGQVSSADWLERITVCDGLSGNVSAARLGVDLLRDSGEADEAFLVLVGRLVDGSKSDLTAIGNPRAVHFALLRQTGASLPDSVIARAGGGFATALAAWDGLPTAQRLLAAERGIMTGALPAGALKSLYGAATFSEAELAGEGDDDALAGPMLAARNHQKLLMVDEPAEKARLLAASLKDARTRGVLPAVAWALRPELAGLPVPELELETLFELGVGEIAAGEPAAARRWHDALVSFGHGGSFEAGALRGLLSARGFAGEAGWTAEALAERIAATKDGPRKDHAILEYAVLGALGAARTEGAYRASLTGPLAPFGAVPSPAVLEGLSAAAANGRTAETLLFVIAALGEDGLRSAHPATLVSVLGALRRAGFEPEARALAAEALAVRLP